ncbi:MAG: hypothetical protein K2X29_05125 [Candidatus Obscuribacterales bacterium]|nr:hypothetical protein [Candidatus Obscuribacterales bacterium]
MKTTVYVQLLNEGTDVWRPVPARRIDEHIYILAGADIYNPDNEEWEFPPGTCVRVEQRQLKDGIQSHTELVAVHKHKRD